MKKTALIVAFLGASVVGSAAVPAHASSECSTDTTDAPVAVDTAYEDSAGNQGLQVCSDPEPNNGAGTLTVTSEYVVVDGAPDNWVDGTDGYIGVDGSGPVACSSGDYEPGGDNNSATDSDEACTSAQLVP